jgi:hypothetical protein
MLITCSKCGGLHSSFSCTNNMYSGLNSNPVFPKKDFEPITLPKFDYPKPNLEFITPKYYPFIDFDRGRKEIFDGGAVNIIREQQIKLGPPPGQPPIYNTGPQMFNTGPQLFM